MEISLSEVSGIVGRRKHIHFVYRLSLNIHRFPWAVEVTSIQTGSEMI